MKYIAHMRLTEQHSVLDTRNLMTRGFLFSMAERFAVREGTVKLHHILNEH